MILSNEYKPFYPRDIFNEWNPTPTQKKRWYWLRDKLSDGSILFSYTMQKNI